MLLSKTSYNIVEGYFTGKSITFVSALGIQFPERTCPMVYVVNQNGQPLMSTNRHGKVRHLLITNIIIETASFDIQKIKNPSITGIEYQEGDLLDFWNVREFVLWRDEHTCQHCKGKSKDKILNVHHIESRKTGGNAPNNLITLCETCHKAYHEGKITLKINRGKSYGNHAMDML